jgi:DNA-binding PucR family transcriptional regulator
MKETAHKMHVHPNTIAYRIARIEELFDININASDQRLLLDLALKLKDLSSK